MPASTARLLLTRIIFSVALLSLSACSWFSEDEPEPAALVDFDASADLDKKWSDSVGEQGDVELYIRLGPVLVGDVIYAASADGDVTAIDRNEGDDLWSVSTDESLIGAVGAGDGLVLVSTVDGVLIALSSEEEGKELWRAKLSSEMLAAPQAADGVVVAQTIDGKITGFDKNNGTQLWQYNATVPTLTLRSSGSPVLDNGIAYIALASGRVIALNVLSGLQLWEQQVTLPEGRTELERLLNFDGQPLLVGNDLYVSGYQGRVTALEKNTGKILWSEKLSTTGQPAFGNGNLYVTQSDDTVVALKMATGRRLWENNQMSLRQLTAPVVIGDYVAVADFDGYVHLLNQSDGQFADRYSLWHSEGIRNALLSDGNTLYILANSGKISALILDQD